MAALGWLLNLDFAAGANTAIEVTPELAPTGGGIGKRRKRAYAGYPRRILLNGTLYTVHSPDEERRLLESFIERESVQVANDAAAGRVEKARKRRLVVRRAERRIDALADRAAEHYRRLHDEDDEILTLIAGSGWLH